MVRHFPVKLQLKVLHNVVYLYFKAVKILGPAGKPTHLKSLNSDKIRARWGYLSALGDLQYFSSIGPRLYWGVGSINVVTLFYIMVTLMRLV